MSASFLGLPSPATVSCVVVHGAFAQQHYPGQCDGDGASENHSGQHRSNQGEGVRV